MDISLADLLTLEPRLVAPAPASGGARRGARVAPETAVSWAVSARTTPPHLPQLRGGELLLIPPRVVTVLGATLHDLLKEARQRQVSGVVFALDDVGTAGASGDSPGLSRLGWSERLNGDAETSINRTLTACRTMLYRVGSDLERALSEAAESRGGVASLVRIVEEVAGTPLVVRDAQGRRLAASPRWEAPGFQEASEPLARHVAVELAAGATMLLGPLSPEQRILARFLQDRLTRAVDAARRQEDAMRPRGVHRAKALGELLGEQGGAMRDRHAMAMSLGLDPNAVFLIAVSDAESLARTSRILSRLGTAHLAESPGTPTMLLVEVPMSSLAGLATRLAEAKRLWDHEHRELGAFLAVSGPSHGVELLPGAAREALFVKKLQEAGEVTSRAASFESVEDLGATRLLYQLRGSDELWRFVADALGPLRAMDPRGLLRTTLRAFLESGGSHVAAARTLGIHRNTLAYRLRRAEELLGHDLTDPHVWLALHLALNAETLLERAPREP